MARRAAACLRLEITSPTTVPVTLRLDGGQVALARIPQNQPERRRTIWAGASSAAPTPASRRFGNAAGLRPPSPRGFAGLSDDVREPLAVSLSSRSCSTVRRGLDMTRTAGSSCLTGLSCWARGSRSSFKQRRRRWGWVSVSPERCSHLGRVVVTELPAAVAAAQRHRLIRSLEPGEEWSYCFVDDVAMIISDVKGQTRIPPSPMLQ